MADTPQESLEKLLKLVQQECTLEPIQALLRAARDAGRQVRINEDTKEKVIQRNLREALGTYAVQFEDVYAMLFEAEENGNQHIFFYRTNSEQSFAKYNDPEAIATSLLGENWREAYGEPQFSIDPAEVQWSHFRIGVEGEHRTWAAKLYSGVQKEEYVTKEVREGNQIAYVYETRRSREVYLIRWHSAFNLLELRVPRSGSRKAVLDWLGKLWTAIEGTINPRDFEPWDLHRLGINLIRQWADNKAVYRLGNARLMDEQAGTADFNPPSGEQDLRSDPARDQAIQLYHQCRELGVFWLPNDHGPTSELRTIIGKCRSNDILIAAKTTAEAVDYVTKRLRDFAV